MRLSLCVVVATLLSVCPRGRVRLRNGHGLGQQCGAHLRAGGGPHSRSDRDTHAGAACGADSSADHGPHRRTN